MSVAAEGMETCLTFTLGSESYGLNVRHVREVLDYSDVTRVPRMPAYMCGVINLRGSVVPVVDLRLKLGMTKTERTAGTCIIVMEVGGGEGDKTVLGALADSVREVFELDAAHIEPPPRIGTRLNTEFLRGMGKWGEEFIILLDAARVFSVDELDDIDPESASAERGAAPS